MLDRLGEILRQSRWRPSSRANYNAWFRTWLAFCKPNNCLPIPAKEKWLFRFLTYLTLHYSVSTIKIAVSAVIAIHRLNGFKSPIRDSMQLEDMIVAVEKIGIVGCRAPKHVVDASFVAAVVEQFVDRFPVFETETFNPHVKGDSVRWLRSTGLVILGTALHTADPAPSFFRCSARTSRSTLPLQCRRSAAQSSSGPRRSAETETIIRRCPYGEAAPPSLQLCECQGASGKNM